MSIDQEHNVGPVLSTQTVRELAQRRGHPVTTSLYLDVDGRRFPRPSDYAPNVDRLFRQARRLGAALDEEGASAVESDLGHLHRWLAGGFDRSVVRGIAAFSSRQDGLFGAFGLPVPVRDQVAVGPGPAVLQLCEVLDHDPRSLVVLVDRRQSRMFHLEIGHATEHAGPSDEPPRRVDNNVELGGFGHFEDEAGSRHLRAIAQSVAEDLQRWPAELVILGGLHEAVAELRGYLASEVDRRVAGEISAPMTASTADLAAAAQEVIDAARHQRVDVLVDQLGEASQRGQGGVAGLPDTLEALSEDRVRVLVVGQGLQATGTRCRACGRLTVEKGPCLRCGAGDFEPLDVVEACVRDALAQGATVAVCDGPGIARIGLIGGLERF